MRGRELSKSQAAATAAATPMARPRPPVAPPRARRSKPNALSVIALALCMTMERRAMGRSAVV
jgi:hypothetical protein